MKKNLLSLFLFFVFTLTVSAQLKKQYRKDFIASAKFIPSYSPKVYVPDSLKLKTRDARKSWFFGTSLVPVLNLVSYNSFMENEKVKFKGIRLGAEVGEKIRFGLGAYKLAVPIQLSPAITDYDTVNRQLRFHYYSLFCDYIFYEDFRWELAVPVSIAKAFGEIDTFSLRNGNRIGRVNADSTGLATIGFDFEYRFIPWLGLGGGVGYRQALAPKEIREKLNAPFYAFKLKIFLGYLYKAVFKREELARQKTEYKRVKAERKKAREEKHKNSAEEVDKVEGIDKPGNIDY